MPNASHQKKPKRRRCTYQEGRSRCKKYGEGNPTLCDIHATALGFRGGRPSEFSLHSLLDGVKNLALGKQTPEQLGEMAIEAAHSYAAARISAFESSPLYDQDVLRDFHERIKRAERVAREKAQAPPPTEQPTAEDPRSVLGFGPDQQITRQDVKDRQKALIRMFHPDVGGSTQATQRVNDAARELLKTL